MGECSAMRESMPLLLIEALDRETREEAHQHIESCAACSEEWVSYQETWRTLGALPQVEPPPALRERVLSKAVPRANTNVLTFARRPPTRWLAQAAAVAVIAGAAWYGGQKTAPVRLQQTPAEVTSIQPVAMQPMSIAETRVLPASAVSPHIEGRPELQNVQFVDADPTDNQIGLSFDVTSRWTVTGSPTDKSVIRLLSYVLENEGSVAPSRSGAIDWVRRTYADQANTDPEIANAVAKVLRSAAHEGVRIRAVDTLKALPSSTETRAALIEALKSDPNPAVRIKAVEALASLAESGGTFDTKMIDTLRDKVSQGDENPYVRVKAAEALGNIRPE